MNKIFKVIWSKSKQCYVVVSEMAKNTTGKKKIIVASILAGLAMSTMGPNVMAVSSIPFTDKPSSALGNGSVKPGTTNGVAIGNAAYSDSHQSIAIGFRSLASGTFLGGSIKPSVAVGAGAHAEGNNTVAIGTVAENRASYGVSLGNESKVTSGSDYGIAIGYQTQVSAVHSMAIGEKANASATLAIALGANAKATGAYSYTAGFNSESGGEAAIAVGKSASAGGGDAVAIGTSSQATGGDSIALGKNANASDGDSIAIGQDTVSDKINSVALGKTSKATGASATALGPQAKATGSTAVAIGLNSEANQSATVAVGYNSAASGENAAAYGNTAKAAGKNSLALGANTQATVEGGVALGAGSIANTVAGAGYNPNTGRTDTFTGLSGNALTSTWAAVSIGDGTNTRQLTGLAAGTNNTDAVNVAQLKSMNLAFTADGSTKGDVNLTNSALNVVGDSTYITTKGNNQTLTISGKKQTITVTDGTASASAGMADANNVAQAINQANAAQTISYKANGGTANTVKVSDGLNFTNGTTTVATIGANGQVTYDLNTTTKQSITDSSTAVNRTIALGGSTGSTTAKKLASGDVKFNIKGQTGTNALISTSASGDDVTIAPTSKLTDAVTAAENAANKDLSNLSTAGNTYIKNLAKTAAAWNVSTNGSGTTAVSGGDTVNFVNGDNIAVTNTGRMITIGTAKNVSFDKVTVGGLSIDKTNGINAGNKEIKGLATGTTATSAVNKQQMDDAVKAASDATTALGKNTIALGSDSGSTTDKKLSTSAITFNIKGDTGANALITTTATGDNVSITPTAKLTNAVAAAENAANKNLSNISSSGETVIKNLAKGAAQDAVKVAGTGLATVSDNTTGGVKTYTVDVNTGNLVVTANGQVGAAGTTGVSGATGSNGVATTQNVATAINDAVTKAKASTTQALADAEHKFAGDTGTTSVRKHGEVLSIKGGVTNTASLTTGNIGVVSDGAGTLNVQLAKVLSGLTSATFTTAGGNTTVINSDGVTITPSAAGASAISMTTAGINAGNKEIKGVATGTTADAAVNKAQMDAAITAAAGASLSTEKVVAKTLSGDTNLATVTGQTGTAKGETYEVAVSENAVKNVAKAAAQDAVTVTGTGLATVSDNTAGGVKTYTVNVEEGKLVLDDTTGQIGANGATQGSTAGKNGIATTQNVATAINDAVTKANANNAQALADAKHNFAGDDATVISRKHGEQLNIKGGASTTATDLTSGNIAVVGDTTTGTLNIKMAKALTGLTSATFTDGSGNTQTVTGGSSTISDAAGNSTVVSKGGVTTTDAAGNITTTAPTGVTVTPAGTGTTPISVTTSGISAGNKEIKNVANGTTDDAAVNKKQMDDAVKSATDATTALGNNTIALGGDTGSTTAKKLSTNAITFNIKGDTGANALITTSATGDNVTIAPTAKLTAAVTAAEKSADKDLSNLSAAGDTYIKNLAKTAASWNVETNGGGTTAVAGGESVNFINGDNIAITNAGRAITIGTAKNVSFDKVTVGGIVLDKTNGINAGGKEVKGIADGTAADSAVSKGQMETAIANAQTAATSTEKVVAKTLSGDTNLATVTGQTGTAKGETYEVAVSENAVKNVAKAAAQDAVTVTGTGLATVSDNTAGGVKTYTVNVDEGKLVLDDTTGKIGANGATQGTTAGKNGIATTQNVATAINDAVTKAKASTTQALADAEHKFDGDTGATSVRKHGEVLSIKGGVTTPADLATGNIGVVSDGAGTLNIRLAKVLSGLTSATFTTASGNTTVINGDGVTITPSGTGASAISMTTDGINAGGTEIKNIADGTAATSAVSKGQMETAIANAQTAATSTEKVIAKALTGDTNLATVTGQTGTAKGETYEVAVSENAVKNVAKAAAQDAVTVTGTGLATVSDNTTGGVKTYTVNVDEGKLVLDDTTGQIGANGATQGTTAGKNGVATTQNVATAINDAVTKAKASTTQALADAEHKFDGDTGATSVRKHGEVLSIKGGVTTPADLSTGNIGVVSDGAGTLNIRLAKVLSGLTSATFTDGSGNTQTVTGASSTITDGAGNTTAMTKGGLSTTDGTNTTTVAPAGVTATDGTNTVKLNGSGIDAGNTQIKNVGKATTDDAAVNKKQMDDAVKSATDATTALGNNTIALGGDTGSTTAKKLSTNAITFNIKGDTGANALITSSATGDDVTIAPTAKLTAAVTAAENSADKDLSNISSAGKTVIKDLAVTSAQDAVNVTGTGLATVSDNTTGGVKTYTVDVKAGNLVVDANGQAGAAGATGTGGAVGTDGVATTQNVATAINDAITKSNANTAQALADAEHKFDGDTGSTSVRKHGEVLSIKGGVANAADLTTGNIGVVSDGAGTLNIRLAKVLSGLTSATFKDASGNTTMVTGGSTTIADISGNTQTLAPTKSEIKDTNGVSTVTTKDGVTAKDASGQTTSLTKGGVDATDGNGNTTSLTNTGVSATDGNGHTTGLTNGGLSTTDGTNTTTVAPTGITATDGTNTVKLNGSGIDAGNTEIKNVGKATTDDAAVNKKQMDDAITKATTNATHEFGGDDATVVSRKHDEKLTIKGGASTNAADLTSGNIAVIGDTNGTLNLKLAKVLNGLTSATFTDGNGNTQTVTGGSSTISDAAGNSTVVSKGGVTTTDAAGNSTTTAPTGVTVTPAGGTPISITTDGINAGGKEVKGIANGTTNDAAVNKGQMDAAVQNALDGTQALGNNTITLGGDTGSTDAKKLNTSGGIQFNIKGESGANALIRTTASGNTVSIASTDKLNNAVAAAENAANKDLSNLSANGESRIKDLAKSAASWNVQTNGGATTAVSGGDTVNFVDGKNITITNTGRAITVATKDDVTFNKITVGGMTLDNNGMDAGNKEIKNVAAGTTANSAVNKQQLDNAISGVSNINYTTSSTTDRAGSTPVHSVSLSTGFNFKGDGNIQVTQDAANNGVIHYAMNPNLSGITSITGAGNGAPTMTFNSQNGNTPANVSINSNLDMGGHRITGVGPAEKPTDAVNKQQVDQALRGLTGMADNAARQYASKAGANAAALAALKPIQYDPLEPTQIMAGVGNYKSQTAVALGMAHYTNENTMFNIGVSLDSHDNMVNAGVTHKFGYSPEKKAIPDRYKGGPISSIYVMQDEMQALLAKDQEKDAVISKQASEIDTLRQQNEDMQRKIDMILAKLQ